MRTSLSRATVSLLPLSFVTCRVFLSLKVWRQRGRGVDLCPARLAHPLGHSHRLPALNHWRRPTESHRSVTSRCCLLPYIVVVAQLMTDAAVGLFTVLRPFSAICNLLRPKKAFSALGVCTCFFGAGGSVIVYLQQLELKSYVVAGKGSMSYTSCSCTHI